MQFKIISHRSTLQFHEHFFFFLNDKKRIREVSITLNDVGYKFFDTINHTFNINRYYTDFSV